MNSIGLFIIGMGSVIADLGCCERNNLATVGGIREDFLVARHACVKDDFPDNGRACAKSFAANNSSVFECEDSAVTHEHSYKPL